MFACLVVFLAPLVCKVGGLLQFGYFFGLCKYGRWMKKTRLLNSLVN